MAKIGLGTVQFGMSYGNKSNEQLMAYSEVENILNSSIAEHIDFYDTAVAYGLSEERLGQFDLHMKNPKALISTKIPVVERSIWSNEQAYFNLIKDYSIRSLKNLKMEKHRLLQFHQCDLEFLESPSVKNVFARLLEKRVAENLGISIYSEAEANSAASIESINWLQVPGNILDRRFLTSNFLDKMKAKGISLMCRSAFLQGVLVEDADLPYVKRLKELRHLRKLALEAIGRIGPNTSLKSLALRYLYYNHYEDLNVVLIGVDSNDALLQNIGLIKQNTQSLSLNEISEFDEARRFLSENELFNPGSWNR
ncbi:MAG: hypothetical protein EOO45_00050 [Flavobacterium sp.]|nr:MAG: hypothetical protein EOO45_00050 [Flavobacterium sp.]